MRQLRRRRTPRYTNIASDLRDDVEAARRDHASRKAKAIEYEEYLKRIADLVNKVAAGRAEDTPATLDTPGKRALYNNLGQNADLALRIDETVKRVRPDGWRGVQAREQTIKAALYGVL